MSVHLVESITGEKKLLDRLRQNSQQTFELGDYRRSYTPAYNGRKGQRGRRPSIGKGQRGRRPSQSWVFKRFVFNISITNIEKNCITIHILLIKKVCQKVCASNLVLFIFQTSQKKNNKLSRWIKIHLLDPRKYILNSHSLRQRYCVDVLVSALIFAIYETLY